MKLSTSLIKISLGLQFATSINVPYFVPYNGLPEIIPDNNPPNQPAPNEQANIQRLALQPLNLSNRHPTRESNQQPNGENSNSVNPNQPSSSLSGPTR